MIAVTTHPFGLYTKEAIDILEAYGQVEYNPFGRRLTPADLLPFVCDAVAIVAGTEKYPRKVLDKCKDLKVISRVGTGFDNIDLEYCKDRGIKVAYTPDAPADSVAEMTVAQIINMIRKIPQSGLDIKAGLWQRRMGHQLKDLTVGVLGLGRIGYRVCRLLKPFGCRILACDIDDRAREVCINDVDGFVFIDELFEQSDIVTVHVPLNKDNYHLVGIKQLELLAEGYLVNNSRGSVVDEQAVHSALVDGHLLSYSADVFEVEPYNGPLIREDTHLTAHMGSSTVEARIAMELGAARNCVDALNGEVFEEVPYEQS